MRETANTTRITIVVDNNAASGLLAEHGFSAWIEVSGQRLLFDTGQGPVFPNNIDKLDIDLRRTDALVLSHGHYDHTGGVPLVIERVPAVHVYIHPAATEPRFAIRFGAAKSIAMPDATRYALERLPSTSVHWSNEPLELATDVGVTGPIPRFTNYEDTGGPFFFDKEGTRHDPIADDMALWIRTEQGLVVIVGCSHAGLINTLHYVQRLSGGSRIHAVLGGFHLNTASSVRMDKTMEALLELAPDLIVPCHCTGDAAVENLKQTFGERVTPGGAGAVYTFG
jgi:7,8-dihydropterin-6-yl-methyl-4-(beta-D-ribofuranosyl)aminobenzene 5'-phosphate synthase